ncbi:MAG: transcription initiation factor IIB, partial [Candidatus Bathyarchaeia archaeon]
MPISEPINYVSKIGSKVGITEKTQRRAIDLLQEATRQKIVAGKDPMGLAAAALYIACVLEDERKTQKEIAEAAGVTEVTVRNRYKSLKESLKLNV